MSTSRKQSTITTENERHPSMGAANPKVSEGPAGPATPGKRRRPTESALSPTPPASSQRSRATTVVLEVRSVATYDLHECIGSGSFATVYRCTHRDKNRVYAMKVIEKSRMDSRNLVECMRREVAIMKMLEHPHIVSMYEVLSSRSKLFIALEFVSAGSLQKMLDNRGRLPEPVAKRYMSQLFDGLGYCHARGVCHRDLKPDNLLLDARHENLKITDFGLANFFMEEEKTKTTKVLFTRCGSPYYVAPEVINATKARGYEGNMADLWSCGVILYRMLSGDLPFKGRNSKELYRQIKSCDYVESGLPADAAAVIRGLLSPVSERLTLPEIGAQPWFKDTKSVLHEHSPLKPTQALVQNAIQDINMPRRVTRRNVTYRCDNVEIQRKIFWSTSTMHRSARVSIVDNHLHVLVHNKRVTTAPFPLPLSSILAVKLRHSGDRIVIKMELRKQNLKTDVPKKMIFVFHGSREADKHAAKQFHWKISRILIGIDSDYLVSPAADTGGDVTCK